MRYGADVKFNDLVRGTITRVDEKGRGIFVVQMGNGKPRDVAVPFAYPGDEVEVMITRRVAGAFVAELKQIITQSPNRLSVSTDLAHEHPGMIWSRLKYETQREIKRDAINTAFADAGHAERINEVIPAVSTEFYRNRMDYVIGPNGEVGLKQYGNWSRFLNMTDDPLLSADATAILEASRQFVKTSGLNPWDNRSYIGDLRYVVVREGKKTRQRMITLVVHDASRITAEHRTWLKEKFAPLCTSLLIGEQPKTTDISLAETFEPVFGNPWLEEEVNSIRYRISPNSFFQTNSEMAAKLQDAVVQMISSANILDLYCGLGFFSIALAKKNPTAKIHGVEIDADAITLASQNALANGVADRCEFTAAKAEDLSWKNIPADTIILDPPRAGLHPRVIETVLEMKPREIVYVSCNFHRLVEELKQFKTAYRIESVTALDLFPHTPHVEVVAKLVRL